MKTILFALILIVASIFNVHSQINIRQENTTVNVKPPIYDSLMTNFEYYDKSNLYQYKKYIGQRLFFKPYSKNDIERFITEHESTIMVVPMPFEKTDIALIFSLNLMKAGTRKAKENLQKNYKEREAAYLADFTIKTNLYKPIIINENEFSLGKHSNPLIRNNVDSLNGKSFLVIDIFSGMDPKNKTELTSNIEPKTESLLFKLLDENKDTLYWQTWPIQLQRSNHFIVQGYYDKQKSYHVGRQFIYRDRIPNEYVLRGDKGLNNNYEKIIQSNTVSFQKKEIKDLNTKEPVVIKELDIWECIDVSLIESGNNYELYYIMKSNNSEIKIPIGEMVRYGFILKDSYDKEQEIRTLRQDEFEALKRVEEEKIRVQAANRKKYLTSKYGNDIGIKLYNGQVSLGMTKEMCREAWGNGNSIMVNSALEVWVYSYGSSLTFNGDKLVQIVKL